MNFLRTVLGEMDYSWQTTDEIFKKVQKNYPTIDPKEVIHAISNLLYEISIERECPGRTKEQRYRRNRRWFMKNRKWIAQQGIR